jgi:glutamyl-tRNA synthetase
MAKDKKSKQKKVKKIIELVKKDITSEIKDIEKIILKHTLLNAKQHGKASHGSVMGKVLAELPEAKKDIQNTIEKIKKSVENINKLTIEEIESDLKQFGKIVKPEKKQREGLPPLAEAKKGKVITRFAPFPSGALHIGNMKAVVVSEEYAKIYKGKFIIRIEDTDPNPEKVKKENIEFIKKDLKAMKIKYNKLYLCSTQFKKQYKLAEKLINGKKAYVCTCPPVIGKKGYSSAEKKECNCRFNTIDESLDLWKKMLTKKIKPQGAVLRLKTDINDPNPALRDPIIMRIKSGKNPTTGKEHWVYPAYNFNAAIEDHDSGVTHILRGTEHAFNTIIQKKVCEALGWDYNPLVINFGFMYMPGEKIHKRFIRDAIAKGKFTGWDDPSLGQYGLIRALIRRGIQPAAIRKMIIEMGVNKQTVHFTWEKLYTENRKIIDGKSSRFFFVAEPIEIKLDRLTDRSIKAPLYPGKRSYRKIITSKSILIDKIDFIAHRKKETRLMHFCNAIIGKTAHVTGRPVKRIPKIHWVPKKSVSTTLIMPDGKELKGFAEAGIKKIKVGQTVQFERIGFARLDKNKKFYFAHR